MINSKKPVTHPEPATKPDASLDRSSLTQEQNSSKPAGEIQDEVSDDRSQDRDAPPDFVGPKGMDA